MPPKTNAKPTKALSRPFIGLKNMGVIGTDGKARITFGYSGRVEAKPELPLSSLAIPLINDLCRLTNYRDKAHCDEDIATLKTFINGLNFVEHSK